MPYNIHPHQGNGILRRRTMTIEPAGSLQPGFDSAGIYAVRVHARLLTQGSKRRAVGRDHETPSDVRVLATCRYKVASGTATLQILDHGLRGWELRLDPFQSRHSSALLDFRPGRFATGNRALLVSLFLRAKYCPSHIHHRWCQVCQTHRACHLLQAVVSIASTDPKKPNWTAATPKEKASSASPVGLPLRCQVEKHAVEKPYGHPARRDSAVRKPYATTLRMARYPAI